MGEFKAGQWIVVLLVYFFLLFLIISQVVSAALHYDVETTAQFNDPGFGSEDINISNPDTASAADTASMSGITASISVITGINAANVKIGIPVGYIYIFSFLFFWLEFVMLLIALFFMLPFFH